MRGLFWSYLFWGSAKWHLNLLVQNILNWLVNWFLNLLVRNVIEREIEREKVQMKPLLVISLGQERPFLKVCAQISLQFLPIVRNIPVWLRSFYIAVITVEDHFELNGWFCLFEHPPPPWGPWGRQSSGMKYNLAKSVTVITDLIVL